MHELASLSGTQTAACSEEGCLPASEDKKSVNFLAHFVLSIHKISLGELHDNKVW